jgi:alkylated DNA repair dioxygenase AlkB
MPKQITIVNNATGHVTYEQNVLARPKASKYLAKLLAEVPWKQEHMMLYGRVQQARRRVCAYGDPGVSLGYGGKRTVALPWSATMLKLKRKIEEATGEQFNYVLLNLYENGRDTIGYHADDVTDLAPQSTIASLSLGATRDFLLKPESDEAKASTGGKTRKVTLESGSLLCMGGNTQKHYKHSVPPRKAVLDPRVNATFRQVRNRRV